MKRLSMLLAAASMLVPSAVSAATLYSSFASWAPTVNSPYLENFNAVVQDVSFNTQSVSYGGMAFSVSAPGFNATGNMIDAAPFDFGSSYVLDGTAYVLADIVPTQSMTIDFGSDLAGFGATFTGLANGARTQTIRLLAANNSVIDSFVFSGLGTFDQIFVGLTSPTPFRRLSVTLTLPTQGAVNDAFGVDNVWRANAVGGAVPESSTWGMMIMGLGLAGAALRARRRQTIVV